MPDGFPPVLRAAADGDVAGLRRLLKKKKDPNAANEVGQTGLHLAAMWGHTAAVEVLVKAGADVNQANDWGMTPLHYAVEKGEHEIVKLLVQFGADKYAASTKGVRPWEKATDDMMLELCGPNVKLHQAVAQQDAATVRALIDLSLIHI